MTEKATKESIFEANRSTQSFDDHPNAVDVRENKSEIARKLCAALSSNLEVMFVASTTRKPTFFGALFDESVMCIEQFRAMMPVRRILTTGMLALSSDITNFTISVSKMQLLISRLE